MENIDYNGTFFSVAKTVTIHTILTLDVAKDENYIR